MRIPSILLLGVLALIPSAGAGEISRRVDPLVFSIHVDLLSSYDLADLRRALEDAREIFEFAQGPSDVACCTQIEAIDLEVFGALRPTLWRIVGPHADSTTGRRAPTLRWSRAGVRWTPA